MYQSSNKHLPSITDFIVRSKNFVIVLISSNKFLSVSYYDQFGNLGTRHTNLYGIYLKWWAFAMSITSYKSCFLICQ